MRVATRIVSLYTHSLKIDIKTAFNRSQVTMIHRMMSDIRHNSARYAETFIIYIYIYIYLALINRTGGLYGRILTEVVSTDRTQ